MFITSKTTRKQFRQVARNKNEIKLIKIYLFYRLIIQFMKISSYAKKRNSESIFF